SNPLKYIGGNMINTTQCVLPFPIQPATTSELVTGTLALQPPRPLVDTFEIQDAPPLLSNVTALSLPEQIRRLQPTEGTLLFKNNKGNWTLPTDPAEKLQRFTQMFSAQLYQSTQKRHDGKFLLLVTDPRVDDLDRREDVINVAMPLFSFSDQVLYYDRIRVPFNHILVALNEVKDSLPDHVKGLFASTGSYSQINVVRFADLIDTIGEVGRFVPVGILLGVPLLTGYTFQTMPKEWWAFLILMGLSTYWLYPETKSWLYHPSDEVRAAGSQFTRWAAHHEEKAILVSLLHQWLKSNDPGLSTLILPAHHHAQNINDKIAAELGLVEIDVASL
ncbi:hypothetical protein KKF63_06790, partial [bacterium]|nr:hypothetical protein [bacterium]